MNFERALESIKTVKLSGGIFGKTTLVLIVLCLCITAITIKIGTWWFCLTLVIPLMLMVFYILKRVLDFAEANPQAAIMDGAEFLSHEKIIHGMKSNEKIDQYPEIDHEFDLLIEDAYLEDVPPTNLLDEKDGE